jgi:MSHA biogenesis protein MshO
MIQQSLQRGFTLIEMVIVIVVGGIVAAMTVSILTLPINAYVDSARRATLTDVAESALRRMQRDIRAALPNSIRVSGDGQTLELLHIINGGRYRAQLAVNASGALIGGNVLDFTIADNSFDVLGGLQNFANITIGTDRVAVYPIDASDAYAGLNTAVTAAGSNANNLVLNAFQFPFSSPSQRFFIVDAPITYDCDTAAAARRNRVLNRYEAYAIQAAQPIPPASPPPIAPAIQANFLDTCLFTYNPGSSSRSGLVTLELTFTDDAGESVRLVHQVHVDNQP